MLPWCAAHVGPRPGVDGDDGPDLAGVTDHEDLAGNVFVKRTGLVACDPHVGASPTIFADTKRIGFLYDDVGVMKASWSCGPV